MSKEFAVKLIAPIAVSASILVAAFIMSSAPPAARADVPATPTTTQSLPVSGGVPSLAPMLKPVMPAVVNISVTGEMEVHNPLMDDPFFRRFFGDQGDGGQTQEREFQSVGSGVIVDAAKGYVITNNHVVKDAKEIKVRLNDDREFDAKLIGRDPGTDIAVLQIKADNLTALPLGDSDQLQVGDFVVAIGSPYNLRQTVTSGIVSALGRTGISDGIGDFIQTDASINPGNSGGALVNLKGQLVGLPSMIYSQSGGNVGIGFAIPVDLVKSIMGQLIEHGSVDRGHIGIVGGQELTPELAKALNLPSNHGALVGRVMPKSPAEKAGIKPGDLIIEANGKQIIDFGQLRSLVGLLRVGDKVDMKLYRDGKLKTVTVKVGKDDSTASSETMTKDTAPRLAGATFAPLDDDTANAAGVDSGVIVKDVKQNSPAARAGLQPDDIIVAVNKQPVESLGQFKKMVAGKGALLLQIRRGPGALFLVLQ
ncbi:DegQ family serine endoprotease [Solimonas marina]|uniref:DegQ family serine endoprotease n=1 Tax=Solimonas marina TaxID=2714601 RepID=A0A969W8S5_9GAMM|nr:DegQ family serine endoprotease [Solimonas marina]NKF21619.1 DegQ family serine endoprotease [Solimonas marina]